MDTRSDTCPVRSPFRLPLNQMQSQTISHRFPEEWRLEACGYRGHCVGMRDKEAFLITKGAGRTQFLPFLHSTICRDSKGHSNEGDNPSPLGACSLQHLQVSAGEFLSRWPFYLMGKQCVCRHLRMFRSLRGGKECVLVLQKNAKTASVDSAVPLRESQRVSDLLLTL